MPNYVRNIVKMKGIADLPLYNERSGEKYFDFQKLIPMPAELEVEDGSRTEQRIIYFLTERCTIPVRDLDQRKSDLVRKLVSNDFAKMDWPEEVFNRTLNWMSDATDEERDNAYEGGRQYISNYETHGILRPGMDGADTIGERNGMHVKPRLSIRIRLCLIPHGPTPVLLSENSVNCTLIAGLNTGGRMRMLDTIRAIVLWKTVLSKLNAMTAAWRATSSTRSAGAW